MKALGIKFQGGGGQSPWSTPWIRPCLVMSNSCSLPYFSFFIKNHSETFNSTGSIKCRFAFEKLEVPIKDGSLYVRYPIKDGRKIFNIPSAKCLFTLQIITVKYNNVSDEHQLLCLSSFLRISSKTLAFSRTSNEFS